MTTSSTFAKSALAAAAGLLALGAATAAAAQAYEGPGYGNYDPCRREASNRGVTGGLLGAAGGAVLGSQFAARGHRTDGSLLGGVVGAIAGAAIGHSCAACNTAPPAPSYDEAPPPPPPPAPSAYYQPEPEPYGAAEYDSPPPPYAQHDAVWAYGRHGMRFRVIEDRAGPDGCTVAESPVYRPDGRIDRRFVHVCPDDRGRYHVVD
ncbi:MAG: glycine zipper 2TM domain-containing protein [Caulobacterales bacterium]